MFGIKCLICPHQRDHILITLIYYTVRITRGDVNDFQLFTGHVIINDFICAYLSEAYAAFPSHDKKFLIFGDYPEDAGIMRLVNRDDPLCVLMCVVERGSINRPVQCGTFDNARSVHIEIEFFSHDPDLRERIGEKFYTFCTRNQSLICNELDNWYATNIQSNGNTVSILRGVYSRSYDLWVNVAAKF